MRVCTATLLALSFNIGLASALFVTSFQPFLAFCVTGRQHALYTASMFLLVWKLYLLDRAIQHPEDASDHEGNAAAFMRRFQLVCWSLFGLLGLAQLGLIWREPQLVGSIGLAVVVSMFYFVKLPLLGKRAKQLPYFKCFYLSACGLVVAGAFTPGMWHAATTGGAVALACSFLLLFLNFSLYDIKDVEADTRANIKTFAAALPLKSFLALHVAVAASLALASARLMPGAPGAVLAGVAVFHCVMSLWLWRHSFSAAVCGAIDGGYALIVGGGALLALHR